MDLNKAMIIGRLTRDPEVRTTPQGTMVATLGLATNYVWTDANGQRNEKTEFHNVVVWRKLAEIASQYLKKGSKLYIEGRLQTRDWDGQDGVKRYRTEIIADNMIMLDRPTGGASGFAPAGQPAYDAGTVIPSGGDSSTGSTGEEEIKVENIPF